MIRVLVDKKLAYAASNGDVYYAVHRFPVTESSQENHWMTCARGNA